MILQGKKDGIKKLTKIKFQLFELSSLEKYCCGNALEKRKTGKIALVYEAKESQCALVTKYRKDTKVRPEEFYKISPRSPEHDDENC